MRKGDKEEETRKKIILVDQLSTNGAVYEDVKQFENSVFSDVYSKATMLVEDIVKKNGELEDSRKIWSTDIRKEIPNVISFIGRRGTGKTSAMLSFYEALVHYSSDQRYKSGDGLEFEASIMDQVQFEGIGCIDVSSLEEAEDIFLLILANMFNKVLSQSKNASMILDEYENRSLLQKFEKIYEDFIALKTSLNAENQGYSSLERLKNIASSQLVRDEFEELVKDYLRIVCMDERIFEKRKKFLIIAIDDLDIYRQRTCKCSNDKINYGCYEIMRSIQLYLSVPNVIVLAAYNHIYLYEQCLEHFMGGREIRQQKNSSQNISRKDVFENKELASQFMEKVFEVNARLYMPSWRKRDFDNENIIKININTNNEKEILQLYKGKSEEEKIITIKKFVLSLLGEKTGIYFDCCGLKKHFFEPDTFRSLYNTVNFLTCMKSCYTLENKKREFQYYNCKDNIRQLKEDFLFHFAQEKLIDAEEKSLFFDEWQMQVIDRRGSEIVNMMSKHTVSLGKLEKQKLWNYQMHEKNIPAELNNRNVEYSLAELIHSIYHMTRDDMSYTKELVACILFSYTIQLTDLYQTYRYRIKRISELKKSISEKKNKENKEIDQIKADVAANKKQLEIFKTIIGNSVCGKWAQYYFPEIRIGVGETVSDSCIIGYQEIPRIIFLIDHKYLGAEQLESQLDDIRDKKEIEFLKIIYQILFIAMTQTDSLYWRSENIRCKIIPPGPPKINLFGKNEEERAFLISFEIMGMSEQRKRAIDLSGCFKYTICYDEFFENLENLLLNAIDNIKKVDTIDSDLVKAQSKLIEDGLRVYRELIKETFNKIREEYYQWELDYGNMMLPIYNLDVTYNIIKRIFLECKNENSSIILFDNSNDSNVFLEEYEKMLFKFQRHLEEIDDYYYTKEDGFSAVFQKCPFINMIDRLKNDESSCKVMNRYIFSIVQDIIVNKGIMNTID